MDVQKLLIADYNEDFREALKTYLAGKYQIFTCDNGKEAIEILKRENCQLMILDLVLAGMDGISLLNVMLEAGLTPKVMVVSAFLSPFSEEMVGRLRVCYAIRKPCDLDVVAARLAELAVPIHSLLPDSRAYLSDLLRSLHLTSKHNGFGYLVEAIRLRARNPGDPITKVLYPAVGEICGCTGRQVERSIRSALTAAWCYQEDGIWKRYFPGLKKRPSNAAFIARMAEELYAAQTAGLIQAEE